MYGILLMYQIACPEANCQFVYCLNRVCLLFCFIFHFGEAARWSQNIEPLWILIAGGYSVHVHSAAFQHAALLLLQPGRPGNVV